MPSELPPLDETLAQKIIQAVSDNFDAQIAFTQGNSPRRSPHHEPHGLTLSELIRFGGQRGSEAAIQAHMAAQISRRGFATTQFPMDATLLSDHPGAGKISPAHSTAPIVVGVHAPRAAKGRSLILNHHTDIVPTGPAALWTHPPYSARLDGDWLHGRGAADMLGGAAANLFALDALRRCGVQPAAAVVLQSVVEEESTGNGTLVAHLKGYTADAAVIPEPEEEMLVRANVGVLWFQVEVRGTPVHVREMGAGANAIDAVYRVVGALRELEERWNRRKSEMGPNFSGEAHPINLNVGKIEGGDWASSVPAWCRVDCRIAIFPGTPAAEAAREIEECVAAFAAADPFLRQTPPTVTWNGFFAEGYEMPEGSLAEACLGDAHRLATGEELKTFMTAGYLDTRVHVLYDKIPALCYGPISQGIHGFDEKVSVKSLKRITTAIAIFIARWCGVESIQG